MIDYSSKTLPELHKMLEKLQNTIATAHGYSSDGIINTLYAHQDALMEEIYYRETITNKNKKTEPLSEITSDGKYKKHRDKSDLE